MTEDSLPPSGLPAANCGKATAQLGDGPVPSDGGKTPKPLKYDMEKEGMASPRGLEPLFSA